MKILTVVLIFFTYIFSKEPIEPIPLSLSYDRQKALLGKRLFFEKLLSKDKTISCASCHRLKNGGADKNSFSKGIGGREGKINAPTVLNAYFNFKQFWNGRADTLKDQASGPVHSKDEMGMTKEQILKRLNSHPQYRKLFKKVFKTDKIGYDQIMEALAEFEKALYTPNSKFDRFLRGEAKLSPLEKKGYMLFKKLGCITCHNGVNIGGNSFQKMGLVIPYDKLALADRYQVTKEPKDRYVYKVPSLRNVTLTPPYFHDGSAKTLQEAINRVSYHNLGFKLSKKEIEAIIAFLKTLTGKRPDILK